MAPYADRDAPSPGGFPVVAPTYDAAVRTLPPSYLETRDALHRVASHVMARAQFAATGRLGLRATPGGFATIQFGEAHERLRISGTYLVHESATPSATRTVGLAGASLHELARFAGLDLDEDFSVGAETPSPGDVDQPLTVERMAVGLVGDWYGLTAQALDRLVAGRPHAGATIAQLWPEHFDLALDLAYDDTAPDQRRANLGGAPGDGFHAEPYLYVGPWTSDRPGAPGFWNAPFGAFVSYAEVSAAADPVAAAVAFFESGLARLAQPPGV